MLLSRIDQNVTEDFKLIWASLLKLYLDLGNDESTQTHAGHLSELETPERRHFDWMRGNLECPISLIFTFLDTGPREGVETLWGEC